LHFKEARSSSPKERATTYFTQSKTKIALGAVSGIALFAMLYKKYAQE
jgi:hypothetical protein